MKPNIACFMCNWAFCRNAVELPLNVKVARITCLGRIDPTIVLEAIENGFDAVLLVGCKPPDCHFVEGNVQAEYTAKVLKKLFSLVGLEPQRVKLLWSSPTDEKDFNYYANEFSKEIERLGSSKLDLKEANSKIDVLAARNAASDFRLRVLLGREKDLTEYVNVYGEKMPEKEFDKLLDEIVFEEFIRHKIHLLTKTKPLSIKELAEASGFKPAIILKQIVNMRRKNMLTLDHVEGTTPLYKALEVK